MTSVGIAGIILLAIPPRVYEGLSVPIYLFVLMLLVAVIFLGIEVKGSRSWFEFGPVRFQPAEISKISTSLLLATVMSQLGYRIGRFKDFIITALIILIPMAIIVLQSETGSALVYVGFIFMLYREGLSGWLIFLVGMAILLFILTISVSPYVAVLTLASVASLCISLYSGKFKWWVFLCIPLIVMFAFLPKILGLVPALEGVNPLWILIGCSLLALPFVAFQAFRQRNTFTHLSLISFLAGIALTAVTFIPGISSFIGITMLTTKEFLIAFACALAIIPIVELQKLTEWLIKRSKNKKINAYKEEQRTETEEQN
jgi:rod shape determining protein RodA